MVSLAAAAVTIAVYWYSPRFDRRTDFLSDYLSAKAWTDGKNPYGLLNRGVTQLGLDPDVYAFREGTRNPHPPFSILLVAPLALSSLEVAQNAALLLTALGLAGAIVVFCRTIGLERWLAGVIGAASVAIPIGQVELFFVQVNGLLTLLLVLAWKALRQDGNALSGVLLGFATAIKLFPGFLVLTLLRQRKSLAAAWHIATAAALSVVALAVLGVGHLSDLSSAATENLERYRDFAGNISLVALPFRLVDVPPGAVFIITALVIAACAAMSWLSPARASADRFWASVPWMLLASPIAWEQYLVLTFPLLVLLGLRWRRLPMVVRPWAGMGIAMCCVGLWGSSFLLGLHIPLVSREPWTVGLGGLLLLAAVEWAPPTPA